MGLFHKKEACPVCGGEVKGLFHKKIGGKKALCKDCSAQVSMAKELLKDATPEFIKEHLEYRRENALKYNALHWEAEYDARGTKMGVDPGAVFCISSVRIWMIRIIPWCFPLIRSPGMSCTG